MAERARESFRDAILAWLETADEEECVEVVELILSLLIRRRLRGPRPPTRPPLEQNQDR